MGHLRSVSVSVRTASIHVDSDCVGQRATRLLRRLRRRRRLRRPATGSARSTAPWLRPTVVAIVVVPMAARRRGGGILSPSDAPRGRDPWLPDGGGDIPSPSNAASGGIPGRPGGGDEIPGRSFGRAQPAMEDVLLGELPLMPCAPTSEEMRNGG